MTSTVIHKMSKKTLDLAQGLLAGRRDCLARSITLVESTNREHRRQAECLMEHVVQNRGSAKFNTDLVRPYTLRIGVAGPPGAGKSTFIDKLGQRFLSASHRVAVIPVDPSSHISGGSILGDKTRMEVLSRSEQSYVRASPTRGMLGGIAEHTVDVISLCEAAGFDTVIVESVGLGQSEVDIDAAVDMMLLVVPPGGGDGLQAAKKGIMEAADLVLVNKADGALLSSAQHTKADYGGAMQFIRPKYLDWRPSVLLMSAHENKNLDKVEEQINKFHEYMIASGNLAEKRGRQAKMWMLAHFQRILCSQMGIAIGNSPSSISSYSGGSDSFSDDVETFLMRGNISTMLRQVESGQTTHRAAAERLLDCVKFDVSTIKLT